MFVDNPILLLFLTFLTLLGNFCVLLGFVLFKKIVIDTSKILFCTPPYCKKIIIKKYMMIFFFFKVPVTISSNFLTLIFVSGIKEMRFVKEKNSSFLGLLSLKYIQYHLSISGGGYIIYVLTQINLIHSFIQLFLFNDNKNKVVFLKEKEKENWI